MSYVDDWHSTSPDEQKRLQEPCKRDPCSHSRYLHGETRQLRNGIWRWVEHTPGECSRCRCDAFADEHAITRDEIVDVTEALVGAIRLTDYGIAAVCEQKITRWLGETQTIDVPCGLKPNHEGAHEAKA